MIGCIFIEYDLDRMFEPSFCRRFTPEVAKDSNYQAAAF